MGHQKKAKQARNQPGQLDENMRQLQREMGRKALGIHVSNGGNNDPYEALGSLFSEYMDLSSGENAKIASMAAAIEWISKLTGLNHADVIAELTRGGGAIMQERARELAEQQAQAVNGVIAAGEKAKVLQ